jgi:hypothetical protein
MEWIFGLFELFFVYEAYFLVGEFLVELLGLRVLFFIVMPYFLFMFRIGLSVVLQYLYMIES